MPQSAFNRDKVAIIIIARYYDDEVISVVKERDMLKYQEVIEEIVSELRQEKDMAIYGINVAGILLDYGLIDDAEYDLIVC